MDSWTADREPVKTGKEYQLDIGSGSNKNSLLYLVAVHQQTQRDNPARASNQFVNAIFDNVNVTYYLVEIDGIRHPRDAIDNKYPQNNCLYQNRNPNSFYKAYIGESFENLLTS